MDKSVLDALFFVAEKGWLESPQSYFATLVKYLGESLEASCALIDELLADGVTVRTVGLYTEGDVAPNLEYSLAGTPCENVVGKALCCYSRDIQRIFPEDRMLQEMGAESYVGIPLWDSKGAAMGLIAVIWREPLSDERRMVVESVLRVVAMRCAHELESIRHETRLAEYRTLLHSLSDGFYFASNNGTFLDVNEAYCQLTGYEKPELLRMRVFDIEARESSAETMAHIQQVISNGHDKFETRLRRKNGSTFEVEISAQYWPGDGGRFAVLARDISGIKRAEREKASLEMQLGHAHKLEAVGRLAGGIAHDFNNMLAVILGQTELLLDDPALSAMTHSDLAEIRGAAERSAALTSQLLAFARKQPTAPRVLALNEEVGRSLKVLRRLIGENVELNWSPTADLWPVLLDPTQVDQLLTNLCANARDAIDGSGSISISTRQGANCPTAVEVPHVSADYVCLSVSDDGAGMDEETQRHIFEPFYTTKTVGHGTGLGLATVYGIVTQNGGFIEVVSALGQGSTFNLYFPRCLDEPADRNHGLDSACGEPTVGAAILLVEDEPRVTRIVAGMLVSMGHQVFTAAGPLEALQIARARSGQIDLVLTDVVMPTMNGKELHAQLRQISPSIRCVYMSGYSAGVVAQQGILDQEFRFLQKPFKLADLRQFIDAALRGEES